MTQPTDGAIRTDIDDMLSTSERGGLLLTLTVRSWLVAGIMAFSLLAQTWPQGLFGASVAALFLVTGLIYRALVLWERDRGWLRFLFTTLDIAMLTVIAALAPMTTGGDVPQIFVFRIYGVELLFFILATSALSLSPGLVLWTGGCCMAALWGLWGWIVSGMDRTVSWGDLPAAASTEVFIATFLDPDFIGTGGRVIDTALLLAATLVLSGAVLRARRMLGAQVRAERSRAEIDRIFGAYVPAEVVADLEAAGGVLKPETRTASVLFVDIVGFTRFSESVPPDRLVAVLNTVFDAVGETAGAHRGVIISLIGDAAMVAFNAPLANPSHAADAVAAARALLRRAEMPFAGASLALRIGIATGPVAAGSVGGAGRRAYTLYGDTVNLAQRLETLNKETASALALSAATWNAAGRPSGFDQRTDMAIRGRDAPETVYTLDPALPTAGAANAAR